MKVYNYNNLVQIANDTYGLTVLTKQEDYNNSKDNVLVTNGIYKAFTPACNILSMRLKSEPEWFRCSNPYIIDNINIMLKSFYDDNFICISNPEDCVTRDSPLKIQCNRCGEIIIKTLHNMRKVNSKSGKNRNVVACPNCDERFESLHALVLKQIFKHFYPDTIEEDPSCINPNTNAIMKTDIVNHRLKIAIEVQGGWHDKEQQKERDKIKKEYWINRGYKFYDYKIKNVSVLEYIQYFFPDVKEIPDWVKFDYSNKLNLKKIQKMLNDGYKVTKIAEILKVNDHRIYDALHARKLYYPEDYIKSTRRPIIMLNMDRKYEACYDSYIDAAKANNIDVSGIISCIFNKRYYSNNHFWIPKDLYDSDNYFIPESRYEKFYSKVKKIDSNNNVIAIFDDMYQAAKDIDTIAYKIYEVVIGKKKTTKGFHYEYA